jgi:hypothetical protein
MAIDGFRPLSHVSRLTSIERARRPECEAGCFHPFKITIAETKERLGNSELPLEAAPSALACCQCKLLPVWPRDRIRLLQGFSSFV